MERNQAQRAAAETMNACTDAAGAFERAAKSVGRSAEMVTKDINGIRIIGESLVDRADYSAHFTQVMMVALVVQVYQGQALKNIICPYMCSEVYFAVALAPPTPDSLDSTFIWWYRTPRRTV